MGERTKCGHTTIASHDKEKKGLSGVMVYLETSMQVSLGTGVIWQTSPPIVKLSFSQGRIRPNATL